ncbi:hypothetical protein [Rhizobium herbae]|uniref:FCD domain-containing protein n=1 Tax=Rhizobium herbae TaxID=508661 RepID=A0ABS4EPA3_9HYPH|nr:hypothetical protein [Rhizobium herbae]MBP1859782.1 hypothetical protein [Rhizobium herbae]
MTDFSLINWAVDVFSGLLQRPPAAWYEAYVNRETAIAFGSAILGAIAGGAATIVGEVLVLGRQQKSEHQSQIIMVVAKTTLVRADLENLHSIFSEAQSRLAQQVGATQLWQMISRLHFTPTTPDYQAADAHALFLLRDRILLENAGTLFGNHLALQDHVSRYNQIKAGYDDHVKDRFYLVDGMMFIKHVEGDVIGETMIAHMNEHLRFMTGYIPELIGIVDAVQKRIGTASKQHFGSIKFLKLPEPVA